MFTQIEGQTTFPPTIWETDHLVRSADRKWAFFSADKLYLYSSDSDSLSSAAYDSTPYGVRGYALNADGSKIAVASANESTFFDRSFNILSSAAIPYAFQNTRTALAFSPDGNTLLVQYSFPMVIEEVNVNSLSAQGYIPMYVNPEGNDENMLAVDSTGRIFAAISDGIRLTTISQPLVPNPTNSFASFPTGYCPYIETTNAPLNTPVTVQVFLGTTTWLTGVTYYFNGVPATENWNNFTLQVPPSSVAGPVDEECIDGSGNSTINENGFSDGVQPTGISANLLPPTGPVNLYVFGYGLQAGQSETPFITLGGQAASNVTALRDLNSGMVRGFSMTAPAGVPALSPPI